MPPKRKVIAESPDNIESLKKSKPNEEPAQSEADLHCPKVYRQVYDHVVNQEDSDGRSLSEMFETLPSKNELQLYYDIIEDPIDFKTIKKKITSKQYSHFEEFESDVLLLITNAHTFNEPRSQISKDATLLKRAFHSKKQELFKPFKGRKRQTSRTISVDSEQSDEQMKEEKQPMLSPKLQSNNQNIMEFPKSLLKPLQSAQPKAEVVRTQPKAEVVRSPYTGNSTQYESKDDGLIDQNFEHNAFSILYNTVVGYTDQSGRRLALPFLRLPNKRCYTDYYELIKRPVSLSKTRTKIKQNHFHDIHKLGKDLVQAFENAIMYNKAGTSIHDDATFLRNYALEKLEEVAASAEYMELRENLPAKKGRKSLKTEDSNSETPKRRKPVSKDPILSDPGTPDNQVDKKYLKKKLSQLYKGVVDHKDSQGRQLCAMFEELPDEDEYPDYYKVIPNPMDMKIINNKLQSLEYNTEDEFIQDFETMFQNARHYNEESSEVYKDSVALEKALKKKKRWLNNMAENKSPFKGPRTSNSPALPPIIMNKRSGEFANKCQELLYHIRSYEDENGRSLSEIFEKLPSRMDYPDYFLLIKKPIDLSYISTRLNKYSTLEDFEQDMLLLFNNACQYNDPDSQIYKDALTLLRELLKKKKEILNEESQFSPNIPSLVQSLLNLLHANVLNHKDDEGRIYSDSLLEVEVSSDDTESKRKPISLQVVGQLLKLGFYKRIDRLQDDLFSIFEKARREGRTDSEVYEDACELQMYFIMERDRLTKDGLRLMTQAVNATQKKVQTEIDVERKVKQQKESEEDLADENDENNKKTSKAKFKGVAAIEVQPDEDSLEYLQEATFNGVSYNVGDFVYVTPEEPNRSSHIMSIEKIWTQKDGLQGIFGAWFCRPEDTFHLASRKFMEREVFRSYYCSHILFSGVIGKCYVMNVKEYPKFKPMGFSNKDVFVCESRYNGKTRTFKKLKTTKRKAKGGVFVKVRRTRRNENAEIFSSTFPPVASHIELAERDEAIQIKRVSLTFNNSTTANNDDAKKEKSELLSPVVLSSIEGYEYSKETNCVIEVVNGCTYYEKYVTDADVFKLGDSVYVESSEGFLRLAKIEKIWKNESGDAFCHCIMFVFPEDTKSMPTQLFSVNECFESNVEEDILISTVRGKCSVLTLRDYQSCRPTEMEEKDVYLCSAVYNEDDMKFRRNVRGCKRLQLPQHIRDDEYWYFDQPINPKRRPSHWLVQADETPSQQQQQDKETSNEDNDEADGKEEGDNEQEVDMEKIGFSLFRREFSAAYMRNTPDIPASALERMSEDKWKALTDEQRQEFKERAKRQGLGDSLFVYHCQWADCQHQYEVVQDLMIHVVEGQHLSRCPETGVFPCKWKSCERETKQLKPLKTHAQLVRHIREIHFKKITKKKIIASDKSKFYFPAHQSCDDFRDGSDTSSHVTSPLSPRVPPPPNNGHHFPPFMNGVGGGVPPHQAVNTIQGVNPLQMQAGMYPPFRMNGQPPNNSALLLQQQMYQQQQQHQQQQLMMQAARRPIRPNQRPPHLPTSLAANPMMQQSMSPQQPMAPPQQNFASPLRPPMGAPHQQHNGMPSTPQGPILNGGAPGMQQGGHGLTPEQQQLLLMQVQQQHHQIMKLQEQVKTLTTNAQQQQQPQQLQQQQQPHQPKTPVFVRPPASPSTKLRHSEAYLRYIEGLRDNQSKLSNWNEMSSAPNKPNPPTAQLPTHWLNGNTHGQNNFTHALWQLRDHMLRDSVTLSKNT